MKYCSQCGKEVHDYVEMCPNCDSLSFQEHEMTLQQKKMRKYIQQLTLFLFILVCFFYLVYLEDLSLIILLLIYYLLQLVYFFMFYTF